MALLLLASCWLVRLWLCVVRFYQVSARDDFIHVSISGHAYPLAFQDRSDRHSYPMPMAVQTPESSNPVHPDVC